MAKRERSVQASAQESEPTGKPKASNEQIMKELQSKSNADSMHGGQAEFYKHRMKVEKRLAEKA